MNVAQEFEPLYRAAQSLELGDGPGDAALVTITRTRGSTFRRAGASMLVLRDGRLVCELSGGCPQRDIALRAQRAMDSGEPALVAYGRDSNYDVMIETGCGGELEVLIEPWSKPDHRRFLDNIDRLRTRRRSGAMATVYAVDGGVIAPQPQRLICGDDLTWNDIGHPTLQRRVLEELAALETAGSTAATRRIEAGGRHYDVLLESLRPPHALVVVGDGIGAHMLAELSHQLGWRTTLVNATASTQPASAGIRCVTATPAALATQIMFDPLTSVVVMTHRLELDLAYLQPLLNTPVHYIGVIGSRQRAEQIRAAFPQQDPRLHVPAGLDIGSETPQEIALAIAAEILAMRHGRHGGPLIHSQAPIHP